MTFTIIGYCRRTGKLGFCQATSSVAVGGRCADIVPGRAVFTVQATGDSRQKDEARQLMEAGHSLAQALEALRKSDPYFQNRQIAILDINGNVAVNTGDRARPWAGEVVGNDHISTGNVLVNKGVVLAMTKAFESSEDQELEERLLRAVEAGRDAGGQEEGQTSCALLVYEQHTFPIVNLRVDVALEPIAEMRKILDWFKPLIPYYVRRTLDPTSVEPKKAVLEKWGHPLNPYSI